MDHNRIRDYSYVWNQQQRPENDSDISSFVCLPSLPEWVIRQPAARGKERYRKAIELATAEVDAGFFGI
jgi:hypothetical protein